MLDRRRFILLSSGCVLGLSAIASLPLAAPFGAARAAEAAPLTVFAAASLKGPLDRVAEAYTAESGETVVISYAATSALAKQIEAGAPADVFFSADLKWMDYLVGKGGVEKGAAVQLLGNRLVLVAPSHSTVALKIAPGFDLAGELGEEGHLAMADPKSVPAGTYGRQALERLGAWPGVEKRITASENVRVAAALVARGEAPLGIVYETDARAAPDIRIVDVFPADSHEAILYPVAPVAGSTHPKTGDFLLFLQSDKALSIFRDAGFSTLPAS